VVISPYLSGAAVPDENLALVETLKIAVPIWIQHWLPWPEDHRVVRAQACAQIVTCYGDQILYKCKPHADRVIDGVVVKGSPGTAGAFNRLAEGVALAAFQPGGVTVFGVHFEVPTS
jgi:hypothetical protein